MKKLVFDTSTQARRQKAHECCHLLYKLETPNWDASTHYTRYGHLITLDKVAKTTSIEFDETKKIPLRTHFVDGAERPKGNAHLKAWLDFRYPNRTAAENTAWRKFIIENEGATLEELIDPDTLPSFITIETI